MKGKSADAKARFRDGLKYHNLYLATPGEEKKSMRAIHNFCCNGCGSNFSGTPKQMIDDGCPHCHGAPQTPAAVISATLSRMGVLANSAADDEVPDQATESLRSFCVEWVVRADRLALMKAVNAFENIEYMQANGAR